MVSSSAILHSYAMTALPVVSAGSTVEAGQSKVTRWQIVIIVIHMVWAAHRAGRGHGQPTAVFSTIALRQIHQENRGNPKRALLHRNSEKSLGMDVADYDKAEPGSSVGPFIMNPEGVARLFSIDKMNDGPFPEHYEPIESPIGTNPLHPDVVSSPVARIYNDDITNMGKADAFPYIATTYSITELFRHWTKHALLNAIVQPDQFIEIGEALASKKGIKAGDTVKVMSKRGFIKAKAVVTKRLQTLMIDGKQVDTIGIPCHWGFEGATRKGFLANTLTPSVGDANSQTPEYKAFLVNIERA